MISRKDNIDKFPVTNIILAIFTGAIILLGVAYVYNFLIFYIPLIYFNVLIVIGVAFLISFLGRFLSVFYPIPLKKYQYLLNLILALIFIIIAWANFVLIFLNNGFLSFYQSLTSLNVLLHPIDFFNNILLINRSSPWYIATIPLNGILLYLIWLLEVFVIIFAVFIQTKRSKILPYSYFQSKYFKIYELEGKFNSFYSSKSLMENLKIEPASYILCLNSGRANLYSKVFVFYLEGENNGFVTIVNKSLNSSKKSFKEKSVLEVFEIPSIQIIKLLNGAPHKEVNKYLY